MPSYARHLIAFLVAAHGLVYVNAARGVLPGIFDSWKGRSWLLGGAIAGDALKRLALALWLLAGLGFIATAVALAFAPSAHGVWRPMAVAAAALGIASFAVFWDGRSEHLVAQGFLGVVISTVVLLGAIAFPTVVARSR